MERAKYFIKNNYRLLLLYLLISTIFTLELIVYINDAGDQTIFANELKKHGFFEFAIYRYQTWSSRLLIESVTMFMSGHHYIIFDISLLGFTFFFLYALKQIIFPEKNHLYLKYSLPIIFITVFPGVLFTSAGLIPTVTNYLFPMFALVIGWYLLNQKNKFSVLLAFIAIIFAFMQEQFTVLGFIIIGFLLISEFIRNKKINAKYLGAFIVSILGLVSAALAPGSDIRLSREIATWYPGFNKLPLITKLLKGYLETNRVLFTTAEFNIFLVLLLTIIILSIIKRRFFSAFMISSILYTLVINKLGISNWFTAVQKIIASQNARTNQLYFNIKENLYPLIIYTALLLIIATVIFCLFEEKVKGITAVVILFAGYASRMLVSLSPTIYASQLRTYIPLLFAIFVVVLLLLKEGYSLFKNSSKLVKSQ
ncbi:hypothetical protein [Streptococcus macacae]|uniref:Membrane protein n=1 Tax=Streptococcus macacae NCTC 11558 TaxID=764298 RepID=G5JZ85_9STRE|nr:hypothetical protein [Streptococcus macacae]EHJ53235.1 putative membrane protein [Streptococcus macacae NCTC 11558]SUN78335.1 serotype determinant, transmembrane protein [Streptococcus macacae NCTC 11558]